MDIQSKIWHLSNFDLSKRLSKEEMIQMCATLVMKSIKKGSRVVLKHENSSDVYFLKLGTIKIITLDVSGEEMIKDIVKEGQIFGILGLVEEENPNEYAVAMEDCVVCIIDADSMREMMNQNPKLNNYILKLAGLRIKKLERKLESLIYKDAKKRVEDFIMDYVRDFGKILEDKIIAKNLLSNKDIGKLTSTSRQTTNKVLNQLKSQGLIDFDEKFISISKYNSNNPEIN